MGQRRGSAVDAEGQCRISFSTNACLQLDQDILKRRSFERTAVWKSRGRGRFGFGRFGSFESLCLSGAEAQSGVTEGPASFKLLAA